MARRSLSNSTFIPLCESQDVQPVVPAIDWSISSNGWWFDMLQFKYIMVLIENY